MALKHKVLRKTPPIKGASFFDQDTSLSAWPGHYQVAVGSGAFFVAPSTPLHHQGRAAPF